MNDDLSQKIAGKVSVAPPPEWVTIRPVDTSFVPKEKGYVTLFLADDQYHAEKRQHYRREVKRLETLDAVQHGAQYKLDFDPNTQEVVLHSLTIIRSDKRVEQADANRFRFLQREQSLEAFIIHGWATLLLLLEDIRVGDIIDASYTITETPKLLPERFCLFNTMPFGVSVKALHLDVHFTKSRKMQWKSSLQDFAPEVREAGEEISWSWKRENLSEAMPEPNLPAWFLAGTWIQVTDCESWADVVNACLKSWPLSKDAAEIKQLAQTITAEAQNDDERVDAIIRFVQDEFRYLSVNLAFGGQIPSPYGEVLQRRFGDCKDLSCLLVLLLRAIGVPARPVLVNTQLTKKLGDLLPMPVFNHAIVEYELDNERRWVDAVRKLQGGGIRNRPISDFSLGLVIDADVKELQPMPQQSHYEGNYTLKESFLLNTAGPWSVLEVSVTATGAQAEGLRNWFASEPEAVIAEKREHFYAQLFPQVKRLGHIEHKDNRAANEFTLTETYEISGAIRATSQSDVCFFAYESHVMAAVFKQPLFETRKHPCALPFPYHREHIIEVDVPGTRIEPLPPLYKRHPLFLLSRKSKVGYGYHTITYSMQTYADSIMPDQFREFRRTIEQVWPETGLFVTFPVGIRGRRPKAHAPMA